MNIKNFRKSFFIKHLPLLAWLWITPALLSANFIDLRISNFESSQAINTGEVISYSFDLMNLGQLDAAEPFSVAFYLSNDNQWDVLDILVHEIELANLAIGSESINGDIDALRFEDGDYYLIAIADPENSVNEINELNNEAKQGIAINGQSNTEDCSFSKQFESEDFSLFYPLEAYETSEGYEVHLQQNIPSIFNSPEITKMLFDFTGELIDFEEVVGPALHVPDFNFSSVFGTKEFEFEFLNPDEEVQVSATIALNSPDLLDNIHSGIMRAFPHPEGYLIFGTMEDNSPGGQTACFSLIVDQSGQLLSEDYWFDNIFSRHLVQDYVLGEDGSYYFWTNSTVGFDHIIKIDVEGQIQYVSGAVAGSTGSWLLEIQLSPDNQYLWGRAGSNSRDRLIRMDAETGASELLFPQDIFSSNSNDGDDFISSLKFDDQGNIIFAHYFYEFSGTPRIGYEFGLMTPDAEVLWEHYIPADGQFQRIQALGQVSDGFLFLGTGNQTAEKFFIKVKEDGTLEETCDDENENSGTIACGINYDYSNGILNLSGSGMQAPHVKIKIYTETWQKIYSCIDCGNQIELAAIANGETRFNVEVHLFDEQWATECQETAVLDIEFSNPPPPPPPPPPTGGNSLGCDLSYAFVDGALSITGTGLDDAAHTKIKVYDANWELVFSCKDNCVTPVTAMSSANDFYYVEVYLFDENWSLYCDVAQILETDAGNRAMRRTEQSEFSLFPNPAKDRLHINIQVEQANLGNAEIYDLQGPTFIFERNKLGSWNQQLGMGMSNNFHPANSCF